MGFLMNLVEVGAESQEGLESPRIRTSPDPATPPTSFAPCVRWEQRQGGARASVRDVFSPPRVAAMAERRR
eukprot:192663-Alexandrium_andersonii.AAC.1